MKLRVKKVFKKKVYKGTHQADAGEEEDEQHESSDDDDDENDVNEISDEADEDEDAVEDDDDEGDEGAGDGNHEDCGPVDAGDIDTQAHLPCQYDEKCSGAYRCGLRQAEMKGAVKPISDSLAHSRGQHLDDPEKHSDLGHLCRHHTAQTVRHATPHAHHCSAERLHPLLRAG